MSQAANSIDLQPLIEVDFGQRIGQCRAVPVWLGATRGQAILAAYAAEFDVDPSPDMFFFPKDTLKLVLFDAAGTVIWRRDLGPNVIPGMWFCPVLPLDLDGDGAEEIWLVDHEGDGHPLSPGGFRLARLDPLTGQPTGSWPWPRVPDAPMYQMYRNFLAGGYVHGQPVLVTARGTYSHMDLAAYNGDMSVRWQREIPRDEPGARGSHMCPVLDINNDGVDELPWGERCIALGSGEELFCGDRNVYRGHSDVIQPMWDRQADAWRIFTCRESDPEAQPRIVMFDDKGERLWGQIDRGHIDMGWTARLREDGSHLAMGIRIGGKTCGADGRFHQEIDPFVFDARDGSPVELPFEVYRTIPVDLDGDGRHELVYGVPGGDGRVIDAAGNEVGSVAGGSKDQFGGVAVAAKLFDRPGEQLLTYHRDGKLRVWGDRNAADSPPATQRYASTLYRSSLRLFATGWNICHLAGA